MDNTLFVPEIIPKSEMLGLTGCVRWAAASTPMNLAEGAVRAGTKEFAQFVNVAVGSCEKVRYQLHLAEASGYLAQAEQQRSTAGTRA
jgi:four helix bundle protein